MRCLMVAVILNLFHSGFMEFFFAVIKACQLIIHLPIFNVIVPANVAQIFGILIPIFMYDITTEFIADFYYYFFPQPNLQDFKKSRKLTAKRLSRVVRLEQRIISCPYSTGEARLDSRKVRDKYVNRMVAAEKRIDMKKYER